MIFKKDKEKTREIAEKLVQEGKFHEAIEEYQKLVKEDAQDFNIINTIGDLYVKLDETEKAIEEFKKIATYYEKNGLYPQAITIYKKIRNLDPNRLELSIKLAELSAVHGSLSEARTEYLKIAKNFKKAGDVKKAASLYEKLIEMNRNDIEARLSLADLHREGGQEDLAVEEFNDVAEQLIQDDRVDEAEKILIRAKQLKDNHIRTISNLVELLKKKDKRDVASTLLKESLKKDKENLKLLNLLGAIYFESQDFKNAKEVFSKILSLREMEVDARIKLGRIYIQEGNLDEAFRLYEPLINTLIKIEKAEKAVAFLGLILASKKVHLPSLEKLAFIYKTKNQRNKLETVYRVMLEEYREKNLKEKSLSILEELVKLCPNDDEIAMEYKQIQQDFGLLSEDMDRSELLLLSEEDEEIIQRKLMKADLYIEEGLVRNARRILEDLKTRYPNNNRINEKIAILDEVSTRVEEDEIPRRIEEVEAREAVVEKGKVKTGQKELEEEKITVAEIFADTDIIPVILPDKSEKKYYDLTNIIKNELGVIETTIAHQLKGDTEIFEKELFDIVSEFNRGIEENVGKDDYEIHYNLGIAFMEQGLLEEAVDKFILASKEEGRTADCYSLISRCYRKQKDFNEGLRWIEKALEMIEEGTNQFFALKYELASLYEETEEKEKALTLYREIKEWNVDYRDVEKKISELESMLSKAKTLEEEMADIAPEFQKEAEESKTKEDFEALYNLGVSAMEQGLFDEAIEKFKLASRGEGRTVECYSLISYCYRKQKNAQEGLRWIEKALEMTEEGTSQFFALKYELASLYEETEEKEKALALYREIKEWNADYRDVEKKISELENLSSK